MKKLIVLSLIVSLFAIGCQTPAATQAAIEKPQPTNTASPCTAKGWADITNYLYEFDTVLVDSYQKIPTSELIGQLEKIISNIEEVNIDNCTQNARKSILTGLDNRIGGVEFADAGDLSSARNRQNFGNRMIISAREELSSYGIDLNYPAK